VGGSPGYVACSWSFCEKEGRTVSLLESSHGASRRGSAGPVGARSAGRACPQNRAKGCIRIALHDPRLGGRMQLEPLAPPALVQAADWRRPRPLADRAKAREGSPPAGAQHHERKGNRLRRWIRTSLKLHPCLWAPLQAGTPVLPATGRSHEMLTKSRFG